jgi:hypothetical protein
MVQVITTKPHQLTHLHESLPALGGAASDYVVEGGGYDPANGVPRPDFLRVTTRLASVTEVALSAFIAAHSSLNVTSNKTTIIADGTDTATITCSAAAIAADASVDYAVWLDGVLYSEPASAPVASGAVTLTLATQEPGEYLIEIKRRGAGNYESGYITIRAQEAN